MTDTVLISEILVNDRIRKDLGEIDKLANSIKEYGLIQPIVLAWAVPESGTQIHRAELIAGGRRLTALKRLGIKELVHGRDFVWRHEEARPDLAMRFKAIELEENLQRKELSWQEQLAAKAQLLEMMQTIYGQPKVGPISQIDSQPGFGVNRLASMLGESPATTSQDLKVARALAALPQLRSLKNKSEVLSKLGIVSAVVSMQAQRVATTPEGVKERSWRLIEDDFTIASPAEIASGTADLVWTDLPYGADVGDMSSQAGAALATFDDSYGTATELLEHVADESYRVLKPDRFAVFCFGFICYKELVAQLSRVGFSVNVVPCVWVKNSKSGENPNTRYCNSYEPLLVAAKGNPRFIRAGGSNVIALPIVQSKLQSVQKPVELVERFILDTTVEGGLVVDFCAGTGTTGVATHGLKRRSILFERDISMSTIAKARLEALK